MAEADQNHNSVKELIVYSLSTNWPATVRVLHEEIEQKRPGISYHAVHKACRQLVRQGVLKRDGNSYMLSLEWLERTRDILSGIKSNYSGQKSAHLPGINEFHEGESRIFQFNNLEDADNYRKRLQWEYLVSEKGTRPYCAMSRHLRSPLFASERALNLMNMAAKAKSQAYILVAGDTPIDRWCADYYRSEFVRVQTGVPCAETCDTMILGDVVVQLHMPDELRAKFEATYLNVANVTDLNVSDFYNFMYMRQALVKIFVTRNRELSQTIHDQIMSHFNFDKCAFFDVNGTLVKCYLIKEFAEYLAMNKKFDPKKMEEISLLKAAEKRGEISHETYVDKALRIYASGLKGMLVEDVKRMACSFVEEGRVPLFKASRPVFNWAKSYYRTIAITKTTEEIMEALKTIFPFDEILCSRLETKNGRYTGRIKSGLLSISEKENALNDWLAKTKTSLKGSIGFGNRVQDMSFLRRVEAPVIIGTPDASFSKLARRKKWIVFSESADGHEVIDNLARTKRLS